MTPTTHPQPSNLTPEQEEEMKTVMQDDDTGRAVRITWTDSGMSHTQGWEDFKDVSTRGWVMDCESVGLWMGENDKVVMLAHSRDEANDNWIVAMTIYKPCIIKKEWLS